jgi:hypothetical protein
MYNLGRSKKHTEFWRANYLEDGRKWRVDSKMDLRKINYEDSKWMVLAQDHVQWL